MFNMFRNAILVFALAVMTMASSVAMDRDEFEQQMREVFSDPAMFTTITDQFDLPQAKKDVLVDYLLGVFGDDRFIDMFITEMAVQVDYNALNDPDKRDKVMAQAMAFGYQFSTSLVIKGMKRLPPEVATEYISMMGSLFDSLEPKYCRLFLTGVSTQEDEMDASLQLMKAFSTQELRYYFNISELSILSELRDYPMPQVLNDYQIEAAMKAFDVEFEEKLLAHPSSSRILNAFLEPNVARDEDFCDAGRFFFNVISDMEGMTGEWYRVSFIQTL
ncbi:MAG: hypothetical protein J4F41_09385, partial [Alphaproteobacteria bacterium]|nr:hypothetical protein [Alphaproteobacteria bacterium]